jgi:hypothetical protein
MSGKEDGLDGGSDTIWRRRPSGSAAGGEPRTEGFKYFPRAQRRRPRRGVPSQVRRHPLTSPWWALETPRPC